MRYAVHLVQRFFSHVGARPLSPAEQDEVAELLRPEERELFWRQSTGDQRHGLETARRVFQMRPDDAALVRAGLLHDIGKHHAGLGAIGRSLATLLRIARLPTPGRFGEYLRHGSIGADELERAGAERLTVAFARFHPGGPPVPEFSDAWSVLLAADHGGKAIEGVASGNSM